VRRLLARSLPNPAIMGLPVGAWMKTAGNLPPDKAAVNT
jgi:hypothetical protein